MTQKNPDVLRIDSRPAAPEINILENHICYNSANILMEEKYRSETQISKNRISSGQSYYNCGCCLINKYGVSYLISFIRSKTHLFAIWHLIRQHQALAQSTDAYLFFLLIVSCTLSVCEIVSEKHLKTHLILFNSLTDQLQK